MTSERIFWIPISAWRWIGILLWSFIVLREANNHISTVFEAYGTVSIPLLLEETPHYLFLNIAAYFFVIFVLYGRVAYQEYSRLGIEEVRGSHQDEYLEHLTASLRMRAKFSRLNALISFILIVVSLIIGTYIFLLADVVSSQSHFMNLLNEARDTAKGLQDEFIRGITFKINNDLLASGIGEEDREQLINDLSDKLKGQSMGWVLAVTRSFKDPFDEIVKRAARNNEDRTRLVSAITTRIGTALLLLFLVQILATMYKYNIRVAAHFDSRADAIQLCRDAELMPSIGDLGSFLSPGEIDFGRIPQSSFDKVIDKASELVSKTK